jgi:hypothetical protein
MSLFSMQKIVFVLQKLIKVQIVPVTIKTYTEPQKHTIFPLILFSMKLPPHHDYYPNKQKTSPIFRAKLYQ